MNDEIIYREIDLGQKHKPTGKTKHYRGAGELPKPAHLKIVRYSGDPGYLLLYLDKDGNEMTDTYHETLEDALEQANWEFGIEAEEWKIINL